MTTARQFTGKSASYDRHRWSYDPAAAAALRDIAGLDGTGVAADLGAGTGALTRHLAPLFARVLAIDPNAEMLERAREVARDQPGVACIRASAEQSCLRDGAVDLVAVGRALHWFEPQAARREMIRILRPPHWLAVFSVPCLDDRLLAAVRAAQTAANGWNVGADKHQTGRSAISPGDYFRHQRWHKLRFPQVVEEHWADFLGRICSLSPAPHPHHPLYPRLETALREVFDAFSDGGVLMVRIATELAVGTMDDP